MFTSLSSSCLSQNLISELSNRMKPNDPIWTKSSTPLAHNVHRNNDQQQVNKNRNMNSDNKTATNNLKCVYVQANKNRTVYFVLYKCIFFFFGMVFVCYYTQVIGCDINKLRSRQNFNSTMGLCELLHVDR